MTALTQRGPAPVTGAVMIDGEIVCFDLNDYRLEDGDMAVVIGAGGKIVVAEIKGDTPEEMARLHRTRSAIVSFVSGLYPASVQERLQVKVLGRYVPRQDEVAENVGCIQASAADVRQVEHA